MEETISKKKKIGLILISAAVLIVCMIATMTVLSNSPARKLQDQLELGEKYLSELDYEQAIVAYRAAIQIDPKSAEAYLGLAEAYVATNDLEAAIDILSKGAVVTQNSDIIEKLQEVQEMFSILNILEEPEIEKEPESEEMSLVDEAEEMMMDDEDEIKIGEVGWRGGEWTNRDDVLPYMNEEGYIVFGAYEQDGDESNGPEPIEWEVLDDNGDRILLISRYVLDAQPFSNEDIVVTWETCSLRKWLNEDFCSNAFTVKEQEKISIFTIHNMDNVYWETEGGNDTQDKIFLLDVEQVCQHYVYNSWDNERMMGYSATLIVEPTEYAKKRDVFWMEITEENYDKWNLADKKYGRELIGAIGSCWWLRTLGHVGYDTCVAGVDGSAGWFGGLFNACDVGGGVRPVLFIEGDRIGR